MEVGEPVRFQAHQLEHRCMKILDVKWLLDRCGTQFVGGSDAGSSSDSPACHPHRESVCVVIASRALGVLGGGLATEFTPPDHERFIEQSSSLEILEKPCDR